ncbi:MAG: threonylcarbamoyl-AMP synthase [Chloroflexi bacterium]|nr:threonylcarbamoyl-AMP synthase [Chloroflexota bacterium]
MNTMVIRADSHDAITHIVRTLQAGGLVSFPTDTVYGLAAIPSDKDAVERLYEAKDRSKTKAIPLLLSESSHVERVAHVPSHCSRAVKKFWPGGLTLILPKSLEIIEAVSPGPSVAVRVPDLALAREIIEAAGGVLAVTSANLSDHASATCAADVERELGGRIELIVDGGSCGNGLASTILDCTVEPPLVLRHGAVSEEALQAVLGSIRMSASK